MAIRRNNVSGITKGEWTSMESLWLSEDATRGSGGYMTNAVKDAGCDVIDGVIEDS